MGLLVSPRHVGIAQGWCAKNASIQASRHWRSIAVSSPGLRSSFPRAGSSSKVVLSGFIFMAIWVTLVLLSGRDANPAMGFDNGVNTGSGRGWEDGPRYSTSHKQLLN